MLLNQGPERYSIERGERGVSREEGIYATLVLVTFSVAPLYWFYAIDPGFVSLTKKLLFLAVFAFVAFGYRRALVKPLARSLVAWLILVILAIAMMAVASDEYYLEPIKIASFILICYVSGVHFRRRVGEYWVERTLSRCGYVFAALSSLVIAAWLLPGWNPGNPLFMFSRTESMPHLASTAFGQARTGWAATAVVFLGTCFLGEEGRSGWRQLGPALIIAASLIVLSTKAGIILAFFVLSYWARLYKSRATARAFAVAGIVFSSAYLLLTEYAELFRLDTLLSGSIDVATTGRYSLLGEGIDQLLRAPFTGLGEAYFVNTGYEILEVHNVFINYGIQFGLPIVVVLFSFIATLLLPVVRAIGVAPPSHKVALLAVISSIATLLWEPQTVISYGHHAFPVWFTLGALYRSQRV